MVGMMIGMTVVLSLLSTAVMGYLSMAVPIGPWIAPMLVLCMGLFFRFVRMRDLKISMAYLVSAGSIGGILATGCGFSFPTLFFLEPALFHEWLASPLYFVVVIGLLAGIAGWFGIWVANSVQDSILYDASYEFPISQAIYGMITVQQQLRKGYELISGVAGSIVFIWLQKGVTIAGTVLCLPSFLHLFPSLSIGFISLPALAVDCTILPMLISIGFISGISITLPLIVGYFAKSLVTTPLHLALFSSISASDFLLAFCSGMVLIGALEECFKVSKKWKGQWRNLLVMMHQGSLKEFFLFLLVSSCFFYYFNFSFIVQLYLYLFTLICTYQIICIAAKIGLAQLGRFATFVMMPALFIFRLTSVQIVFISTFVQVAGGVASDVLFGRKVGILIGADIKKIRIYQYAGLLMSAAVVGVVFWFLITHFGLGSTELFAQKAYARRLLIEVKSFNIYVLFIGVLFGLILKYVRINPALVLGGMLMPGSLSFGLAVGGLISLLCRHKQEYVPFWSGVFAGNSLWMILQAFMNK